MSDSPNELDFRLPSVFLTDEDILMKCNFRGRGRFRFPTALSQRSPPLNAGFLLNSPVESVAGSTEAESDEEYSILTEFTPPYAQILSPNNLQQLNVESGSGRSTGSNKESPNGVSYFTSPPATPLSSNNNALDLMYKAAGVSTSIINPTILERQRSLSMNPTPPKSSTHSFTHSNDLLQIEEFLGQEECGMQSIRVRHVLNGSNLERSGPRWIGSSGDLAAWHGGACHNGQFGIKNHQLLAAGARSGLISGGGYGVAAHGIGVGGVMKSQRVGTGVFLPRKYSDNGRNNAVDSHKKSVYSSAYSAQKNLRTPKLHNNDTMTDLDALLAKRAYILTPQKTKSIPDPDVAINHELCLPQEWTY